MNALFSRALAVVAGALVATVSTTIAADGGSSKAAPAIGSAVSPAPLTPEESLKKARVHDGYRIELVAAEPLVLDPVAFDWDARGRLWVVEMADYPLGMDGSGRPGGRVRILEDVDGDGRYERSTLFAENLSFPTGILTWRDGCIVTAAPEILFLADRDGDGRAEHQRVLFSGFNAGNQQLRINGLRWGLDGWVYCANGGHHVNYGKDVSITSTLTGEKIALGARDFRFQPDTGEFDPLSGPAQYGRARDKWGHWFGVQNSFPVWHYALEDRYLRRNPHVSPPNPKVVLTESNPRVYPLSPPEKRYHSFTQAGRFTSACGLTLLADPLLFRAGKEEHVFVCEPFHNVVQHLILEPDGSTFTARRDPTEQIDFVASEDRWFRPVMVRTGPDGALWIADMYRYMIEHPQFLPPEGREELMPHYRLGDDRGRLYRVLPKAAQARPFRILERLSTVERVELLRSPNGWLRDKAQMMLQWRHDPDAIPALAKLAANAAEPLARVHALHALNRMEQLSGELLVSALQAPDAGVREQALRLAETRPAAEVMEAVERLVKDPDAKVRLQLACSLGAWADPRAGEALVQLARQHRDDPRLRGAVLSSVRPHVAVFAAEVQDDEELMDATFQTALGDGQDEVVLALVEKPLREANVADVDSLRRARTGLAFLREKNTSLEALAAKPDANARWAAAVTAKNELWAAVRDASRTAPVPQRAFLTTLLLTDEREQASAIEQLAQLLAPRHRLQPLADYVNLLARVGDQRVPEVLLKELDQRTPSERGSILDALMSREAWVPELLRRIETGEIPRSALDPQRQTRLIRHPTPQIRAVAARVFSSSGNTSRQQAIDAFKPALRLTGEPAKGRAVFAQVCAACHQLEGVGLALGPDLRSVVSYPADKLLYSILDPNADIQPGYAAYTCELKSGEQLYGAVTSETGTSLSFRLADGTTRTVTRDQIKLLQSSNVSLMPEGLEASLTPQSLADLIAYLKLPPRE